MPSVANDKAMSEPEVRAFVQSMESQNVGVTRTKKGLLLRLPNDETTVVHFTNSDVRAKQNTFAVLRRAGVHHPDDPHGPRALPNYITSGEKVNRATLIAVKNGYAQLGYPEYVTTPRMSKASGMTQTVVSRCLYHEGFKWAPAKKGSGRVWYAPDSWRDEKPSEESTLSIPTPKDLLTVAVENTQDATDDYEKEPYKNPGRTIAEAATPEFIEEHRTPEPEVKTEDGVEFIDERDSWVVDMKEFFGGTWPIVEDKFKMLHVLHMDAELRVWRKQ